MARKLNIKGSAEGMIDGVFAAFADAVKAGSYSVAGGGVRCTVTFIPAAVPERDCDGSVLKAGMERLLVRVSELGSDFQPKSGDKVTETGGDAASYTVASGVLDPVRTFWTLFVQRSV